MEPQGPKKEEQLQKSKILHKADKVHLTVNCGNMLIESISMELCDFLQYSKDQLIGKEIALIVKDYGEIVSGSMSEEKTDDCETVKCVRSFLIKKDGRYSCVDFIINNVSINSSRYAIIGLSSSETDYSEPAAKEVRSSFNLTRFDSNQTSNIEKNSLFCLTGPVCATYDIEDNTLIKEYIEHVCNMAGLEHWVYDHMAAKSSGFVDGVSIPAKNSIIFDIPHSNIHPDDRQKITDRIEEHKKDHRPLDVTYRVIGDDGDVRYVRSKTETKFDRFGRMISSVGITQDVTEIELAHKRLKERARQLELVSDIANVGYFEFEQTTQTCCICDRAQKILDMPEMFAFQELVTRLHPDDKDLFQQQLGNYFYSEDGSDTIIRILVSGKIRHISIKARNIKESSSPKFVYGIIQDVTSLESVRQELVYNKKFLETIIDAIPFGVVVKDVDNEFRYLLYNKFMCDYMKIPIDRAIGSCGYEVTNDRELADRWHLEDVEVSGSLEAMKTEVRVLNIGGQKKYFTYEKIPIQGANGKCRYIVMIVNDLTERIVNEHELLESNSELKRSNHDLEQFAYVASHDLKEPLRMVTIYLQLLETMYAGKLDSEAESYINFAVEGALRMNNLLDCLLQYSRVTAECKVSEPVDGVEVINLILKELYSSIQLSGARIKYGEMPIMQTSKQHLYHILRHLISNAIKYCKPDVMPEIFIECTELPEHWQFSVADNGIGIEEQYYEKIFDIFKQIHSRGSYEGDGLGLSICRRIVERHKGRIWLESKPGIGTTFYFTLKK